MDRFKLKPEKMEKIGSVRQDTKWEPNLAIRIADNREQAKREDKEEKGAVSVYTDGSGYEGQVGAAAVLYRNGVVKRKRRMRLGPMTQHTVYEGEGIGMILGLELIREENGVKGMVSMGVDNVSAITATHSIKPGPGHHIWDTFHRRLQMVSRKHPDMDLLVRWTPGHVGIKGNEEADLEAKKASVHGSSPKHKLPAPLRKELPHSKSAIRQKYHAKLKREAEKIWTKSPRYARMKQIDPTLPSPSFAKQTAKMIRKHTSLLFQLRTGHIPLNMHLYKIQKAESPICPCCHGHIETVAHFITRCPAHKAARRTMIQAAGHNAGNLSKLLTEPKFFPHLFRFIGETKRLHTIFGKIPQMAQRTE
jgi:ribonuclease HI